MWFPISLFKTVSNPAILVSHSVQITFLTFTFAFTFTTSFDFGFGLVFDFFDLLLFIFDFPLPSILIRLSFILIRYTSVIMQLIISILFNLHRNRVHVPVPVPNRIPIAREQAVVDEQLQHPPAKRRRTLAGSIVSTAVNAALVGTAVGLTVYRL